VNLSRILRHVRSSWRILAAGLVVGIFLGGLATLVQAKTYAATAQVLVSPNVPLPDSGGASVGDAYSAGLFSQQRAQSYVELATSSLVLGPAAEKVGIARPETLEDSVRVEWIAPATSVIDIIVEDGSARQAAALANEIAAQLASVVATIERSTTGQPAPVKVTTVRPASVPLSPESPDPVANLLLGLVLALLVGLPLLLVRALLDRSVNDSAAVVEATGEPPLGIIGHADPGGLVLREAPQSLVAEAFRKLGTSTRFARPGAAAHSLVVTGPQADTGASLVAANLALALVEAGRRVVLVDGNLPDPAMSRLFGLSDAPGLHDVLAGDVELVAALAPGGEAGLLVLAAGRPANGSGTVVAGPPMVGLLERLEAQADIVIIDAPPVLLYAAAAELAAIADAALLVARYGKTKVEEVQQAWVTLGQVGTPVLGVVLNGVPGPDPAAAVGVARTPAPVETSSVAQAEPLQRSTR